LGSYCRNNLFLLTFDQKCNITALFKFLFNGSFFGMEEVLIMTISWPSQKRPPLNNDHFFPVQSVVVVYRFDCTWKLKFLFSLFFRHVAKGHSRADGSRLWSDRWIRRHRKSPARLQPEEVGEEALDGNGRQPEKTHHSLARPTGWLSSLMTSQKTIRMQQQWPDISQLTLKGLTQQSNMNWHMAMVVWDWCSLANLKM